MSEELEGFFEALSSEGTTQAKGLSFTLESEKARKKLQEFALAHPEHFQLLALAGLYALGARQFRLTVDADDFLLESEVELPRQPFTNLWSYASGGGEAVGYRLLALSLLTSTRLDDIVWSVESRDEQGCWTYSLSVRSGQPQPSEILASASVAPGVRLKARRTSLGHVAMRYLGRLKDRVTGQRNSEERLVRERLFLPKDTSLKVNGVEILPVACNVLAALESGHAPKLVEAKEVYRSAADVTACVVLVDPLSGQSQLPGPRDSLLWVWNGLQMDSTPLGAEFVGFRAFVWTSDLQPDLSLSQLISDRAKQSLESRVKSLARELLEQYVPTLSQEIRGSKVELGIQPFLGRLEIVKTALRARISLSKARVRLGRLNRSLIDCPILIGSDDSGERRWISFEEIWKELEASRPVAVWNVGLMTALPAYPGRPFVLETTQQDLSLLRRLLPKWAIIEADRVEQNIAAMLPTQDLPPVETLMDGGFELGGSKFHWSYSLQASSPRLHLEGPEGVRQFPRQKDWPSGITVGTTAPLEVNYSGKLVDTELESAVREQMLREFAGAVGQLDEQTLLGEGPVRSLLKHLKTSESHPALLEVDWLPVWSAAKGVHTCSPAALSQHVVEMKAPCFYLSDPPQSPEALTGLRAGLQIALIWDNEVEALEKAVGRKVCRAAWLRFPQTLPPAPVEPLWSAELTALADLPELRSLSMWVVPAGAFREGESLRQDVMSERVVSERKTAWLYPSLQLRVEWAEGWPNCEGTEWEFGRGDGDANLSKACLRLGERFFTEADSEPILAADPALISGWMFDLLSESDNFHQPLFLTAGRERVSFDSLPSEVHFFRHRSQIDRISPGSIYLPGPLADTVAMFDESRTWTEATQSSGAPPLSVTSEPLPLWVSPVIQLEPEIAPKQKTKPSPQAVTENLATVSEARNEESHDLAERSVPADAQRVPTNAPVQQPSTLKATTSTHDLEPLLVDVRSFLKGSKKERYRQFLKSIGVNAKEQRLFQVTSGGVFLGRDALPLLAEASKRVYLHSALYSIFNRLHTEVTDLDEREFHQALLSWAVRLGEGPSDSRTKSPT